jgi:ATP-dependent Clp protease ATP-binding subunit ClpC
MQCFQLFKNGTFRIIFSATEGQWKWLQQNKPQLASLMNFQAVGAPGGDDVLRILENKAITAEHQYSCLFTYNALKDIYRLASRYGPDLAMPAQAINVMDTVARIHSNHMITPAEVSNAIEQTTGVKTGTASLSEKSALLGLDAELHRRVIGQEEAIATIVSALQRSRAGIANLNKPIGTFLFLGPTGVGKTETAKAVASSYFGGEDRLIRVDMNQYITQESVRDLLESGSAQSSTLLDSVKKQPFSVVLFDEIEKAHPDVINTLLQMLDEGVMRDANNKSISFKDAVIIATSNAGAENIESYQEQFKIDSQQAQKTFTQQLISSGYFKPEFVNRFDNIVIYQPLSVEQLEEVVDIQILNINKTLANQQLSVALTAEARSWLASNGHDPLMGARPLRRLMQETVENTVSKKILENTVQSGSGETIVIDVGDLTK